MTDRPILFSAPMVSALLDGRKTQTRRLINFAGIENVLDFVPVGTDAQGRRVFEMKDRNGNHMSRPAGKGLVDYQFSPRIALNDRLWVREAWCTSGSLDSIRPRDLPATALLLYKADGRRSTIAGKQRPSMFMPRWASRLTLIITDVRIERLQGISEEDACAEGVWHGNTYNRFADDLAASCVPGMWFHGATDWYQNLWNRINGPGAWEANPWVVAYSFTVHHQNIDSMDAGGKSVAPSENGGE